MSEQRARRIYRRWPGQRKWEWCWDTTPWGGGHLRDNGVGVGAVGLPDGSRLLLDSGVVIQTTFKQESR